MHDKASIAHREGRSPEACLILAAAVTQLLLQGIMAHLTRQAAPRRRAP